MIKLSKDALQLLQNQRYIYSFLSKQLKKNQTEEVIQLKDYFIPELLCKTNVCQFINQQLDQQKNFQVIFNIKYAKQSKLNENLQEIGKFIGQDMTATDDNYIQFIDILKEKIQLLQNQDEFQQENEIQISEQDLNEEEIKLAVNLCKDPFVVEDINKLDNDTIWTTFKKLWIVLFVILFGGAGIGVLVLNAPLHMQDDLGAISSQVTLFQALFSLGQLFGSPVFHLLVNKIGYKLVYIIVYIVYIISAVLLSFCTLENCGTKQKTLLYIYLIRFVSGFAGVIQPISHSYISQVISTKYRANSSTINNIAYYIGVLVCSIANIIAGQTGFFVKTNNVITFKNGCYLSIAFFIAGIIFSVFVPEKSPELLLRLRCRKYGVKYEKPKEQQCTFKEALKIVFTNQNLILCFFGLIFALGTSNCNAFIAQIFVKKYMHTYNSAEAQVFLSIMSASGIAVVIILTLTVLQFCLRKGGPIFIVILASYLSSVTSLMRTVPTPMSRAILFISALFNQVGICLCDAPYFSIVSLYTTPYNKAKVFGVFQISNSIARALFTYSAGLLLDYQVRNCGWIFTYFTFTAVIIASFVKVPKVKFG